jgi:hypothetical protein
MLNIHKGIPMATEKILLVQPIFCPSEAMFQRNANSIISLGEYIIKNKVTCVEVQFGGWCKTPELWNKILVILKKYFPTNEITSFKNNVGKAVAVNFMVKKHLKPHHQFIMSADSDIIFPLSTPDMFDRLIKATDFMNMFKKAPMGMIALHQLEHGCHLPCCWENNYQFDSSVNGTLHKEKLVWPSGAGGIAGGCIFVSRKAWELVGGYRIAGVYSGDDAYLLLDIGAKGFTWQMAESIPIIHPGETDQEYAQWKVKVCQRDSGQHRDSIQPQITEAEEFWKDRN